MEQASVGRTEVVQTSRESFLLYTNGLLLLRHYVPKL